MARGPKLLLACATALSLDAGVQAQEPETADVTMPRSATSAGTFIVEGREYEIHPAAPTYGGDTGLFDLPSAYTLPKGKFSFSGYRNNLDRDPKDLDISIHGISLGYGATSRLEIFGTQADAAVRDAPAEQARVERPVDHVAVLEVERVFPQRPGLEPVLGIRRQRLAFFDEGPVGFLPDRV